MKKVDGLTGRKFLIGVLIAYFLTFFFSYFYFMTASPLILGKAIAELPEENVSPQIIDPILIKTFSILGLLLLIFIFVYFIPRIIHLKQMKLGNRRVEKYKPFKN
jgi:sterol desaturase/sphingolipid hydroxylase (fatty acid hydroxylase superfamily)